MAAERHDPDAVSLFRAPSTVVPRPCDHEVSVLRIFFLRMAEDLPRSPRIFLVPEAGDVQVGNTGTVQLVHPGFFLPELVIVGMSDGVSPEWNRAVQVFGVDIR